jgi:(1->4)-alpha-D-glucan 1-alpha-D-glucosylmutase
MRATYRLQLTPGFGFARAREIVTYLAALGVSHLYLSPIMRAREGSTHGYDVIDPTTVSPALGGEDALRALAEEAHRQGLALIADFVPNHMAACAENRYWGNERLRRKFFDVDPQTGWHRRFFTIDDLAGVRVEDPEVFEETHSKVLQLIHDRALDGLRIDHVDGLADPAGYLDRLRQEGVERIWVEKILEAGEQLRDWPVQGTTGYEFAVAATALLVDPGAERPLTDLYAELTGERRPFRQVAAEAKLEQARTAFRPEVRKLRSLHDDPALEQAVASLHVYRSYVQPHAGQVVPEDRDVLQPLPDGLRAILLLQAPGPAELIVRFQQTTGAVMAKGVEDTAFYRYLRLSALNEVGGDPGQFSIDPSTFHDANVHRAVRFPQGLLASQTHDTKRSGDVRARIAAIAEHAAEWTALVRRWREINAPLRTRTGPDPNEEYLVYQTLAGAWPIEPERLTAYLEKALREAKTNTSWDEPVEDWEESVKRFASELYGHRPFRDSFDPFVERLARTGERLSLTALLLQLTSPGVPDIYQGDELWTLSLVDPDNRRPVDFEARRPALDRLRRGEPPGRCELKLYVITETLALRRRKPDAFAGAYMPLEAPDNVCAFARGDPAAVIVLAGLRAGSDPGAVSLPVGDYADVLPHLHGIAPLRLLERV